MGRILCALEPPYETTGAKRYQCYVLFYNHIMWNIIELVFVLFRCPYTRTWRSCCICVQSFRGRWRNFRKKYLRHTRSPPPQITRILPHMAVHPYTPLFKIHGEVFSRSNKNGNVKSSSIKSFILTLKTKGQVLKHSKTCMNTQKVVFHTIHCHFKFFWNCFHWHACSQIRRNFDWSFNSGYRLSHILISNVWLVNMQTF